jgi:hypothetical protein
MAIGETKAGYIHNANASTGRSYIPLPKLPSMTLLFVSISATATVVLEISDDETLFIPIASITGNSAVQFAIPASVLSANISANTGTVTVTYRTVTLENMPAQTLLVYSAAGEVESPIITPEQSIFEAAQITGKKLAQTQVAASATTVYTVSTGKQATIEHIVLANPTGSARIVTLWHDGSADTNVILPATPILAGGHGIFSGTLRMEASDTLVADADAATAVTLTAYGYEQDVPV